MLEEAAELMREQAGRRGMRLEIDCPRGLPKIAGDRDRLHQVMLNLIDNAIKYTPREGRVTVEARERPQSNGAGGEAGRRADRGRIPAREFRPPTSRA